MSISGLAGQFRQSNLPDNQPWDTTFLASLFRQLTARTQLCLIAVLASAVLRPAIAAQEPIDEVVVSEPTPLSHAESPGRRFSAVQVASSEELSESRAAGLADYMRRRFVGVTVNDAQGSSLLPNLYYRGFVGSPLLGMPQGIAVYQDGVRLNEPFGDTVNWTHLPEEAIDAATMIPGSDPLFGLNALGGALSIRTRNGLDDRGKVFEASIGSFDRQRISATVADTVNDDFGYFLSGSHYREDGWRDYSPGDQSKVFAKVSWRSDMTSVDVGLSFADSEMTGNGAVPRQLLDIDRSAVFTLPDSTDTKTVLATVGLSHHLPERMNIRGNVYARRSDIGSYNGDDSDFEVCVEFPTFVCETDDGEETAVIDSTGSPVVAVPTVISAIINRTNTFQDSIGASVEAELLDFAWQDGSMVIGLAFDDSDIGFDASVELGALDATRRAVPGEIFVADGFTELATDVRMLALYMAGTLPLADKLQLALGGRMNRADIVLRDGLGTALNGDHRFSRFNPSARITWRPATDWSLFAGYSESNRVPSPVELTCADPEDPCRLPNAFLADPPLDDVVARTIELGVGGRWRSVDWHAIVFRSLNADDILFVSAGALTNEGFFANVGETRRDGIELAASGRSGEALDWYMNLAYLDAGFRETFNVPGPNNPAAIEGEITVSPGDRLPLVPKLAASLGIRFRPAKRLQILADAQTRSSVYLRGDEGNANPRMPGYAVVGLTANYVLTDAITLFARVDNLLDAEYESFGLFGDADEVLGESFDDPRFLTPGPPLSLAIGITAVLD